MTVAKAMSVGSPTDTSHGTEWAVAEPVMRSTPSGPDHDLADVLGGEVPRDAFPRC